MAVDDAFFNRVGHDLRGELATILAGVHFLIRYEPGLSANAQQMLERVNSAGHRMKRLLDEFGNAAWGVGAARELSSVGVIDLAAIVKGAVGQVHAVAEARGVEMVLEVEGDLSSLTGDHDLLEIALNYALDFSIARSRNQRVTVGAEQPIH